MLMLFCALPLVETWRGYVSNFKTREGGGLVTMVIINARYLSNAFAAVKFVL